MNWKAFFLRTIRILTNLCFSIFLNARKRFNFWDHWRRWILEWKNLYFDFVRWFLNLWQARPPPFDCQFASGSQCCKAASCFPCQPIRFCSTSGLLITFRPLSYGSSSYFYFSSSCAFSSFWSGISIFCCSICYSY